MTKFLQLEVLLQILFGLTWKIVCLIYVRHYFEIDNKVNKEAAVLYFVMKGGEIYANTYIKAINGTVY